MFPGESWKHGVDYWKVGFTDHLKDRLTALAHKHKNHEFYTAYVMEGTLKEELELHKTFSKYRLLNEYYFDIDNVINEYLYARQNFIKVFNVENNEYCPVKLDEPTPLIEIWGGLNQAVGVKG